MHVEWDRRSLVFPIFGTLGGLMIARFAKTESQRITVASSTFMGVLTGVISSLKSSPTDPLCVKALKNRATDLANNQLAQQKELFRIRLLGGKKVVHLSLFCRAIADSLSSNDYHCYRDQHDRLVQNASTSDHNLRLFYSNLLDRAAAVMTEEKPAEWSIGWGLIADFALVQRPHFSNQLNNTQLHLRETPSKAGYSQPLWAELDILLSEIVIKLNPPLAPKKTT